MQPNQPNQIPQQPQQPVAFQSSAPIGPMPGQVPLGQIDPRMLAALPKQNHHSGLIATIILSILLVGSLGFGIWAFMGMRDYKTNSDQKSAVAVEKALEEQKIALDADYEEQAKLPYDTYSGPSTAGSIKVQYPKTWSAHVIEDPQNATPLNAYFHPGSVPSTLGNATAFALRMEVLNQQYDQVMTQYDSFIKNASVTASATSLPSVPGVLGTRLTGQVIPGVQKIQGTMIIFPLRDKTIRLWTESNGAFLADFDTAIVPAFSFVP